MPEPIVPTSIPEESGTSDLNVPTSIPEERDPSDLAVPASIREERGTSDLNVPTPIPEEGGTRGRAASNFKADCLLRTLTEQDSPLLVTATVGNVNWCGERFTITDVMDRPEFRHYTAYLPSRGDFGLVAELEGEPVGAVWVLFLPADDPGYGFIDDRTPELSIWVAPGHRGGGVGRALLGGVLREARRRGVEAISLSVEGDNPAKELYRAMGFLEVLGRDADGVMLCRV